MNGMCIGTEKVNWVEPPIDDTKVSGVKTWSSEKIQEELDKKASTSESSSLEQQIQDLNDALASKVSPSDLGVQVTYATPYPNSLYITKKR